MELIIEHTTTYLATVDPDAFTAVYADEYEDFRERDAGDLRDFIFDSIHDMGPRDFLFGNPPWVKVSTHDEDLDVREAK